MNFEVIPMIDILAVATVLYLLALAGVAVYRKGRVR